MATANRTCAEQALVPPARPRLNARALPWKSWLRRYRTRRQLHALLLDDPERLIKDLGIHPEHARAEADKPFWRA